PCQAQNRLFRSFLEQSVSPATKQRPLPPVAEESAPEVQPAGGSTPALSGPGLGPGGGPGNWRQTTGRGPPAGWFLVLPGRRGGARSRGTASNVATSGQPWKPSPARASTLR